MNEINWWNLNIYDQELSKKISSCLQEKNLSYGQVGNRLENKIKDILNVKHVMLCSSGSTALLIALKSINLPPNSEIIIPNITFQATANAVIMAGHIPILHDCNEETGLLNIKGLEEKINNQTKAIIPVHINGRCCDIDAIKNITNKFSIKIIEDAAQAFYCKSKDNYAGTSGDIGCFSLSVTKFVTSAQGGIVVTNNDELFENMKKFLFHDAKINNNTRTFNDLGFNFRLTDIQSTIAEYQIDRIQERKTIFANIYNWYKEKLQKSKKFNLIDYNTENNFPIWIEVKTDYLNEAIHFFKDKKIEINLPDTPLNHSKYLQKWNNSTYESSENFSKGRLILPSGPDISKDQYNILEKSLHEFENIHIDRNEKVWTL